MRRGFNLLGGAVLGLSMSQFPEYTQQYEQRLGGAVDELETIISDFDATAAEQGLDREEALIRYEINPDAFIVERGVDMRRTIMRYERLSTHLAAIEDAGPLTRVSAMMQNYDPAIGEAAFAAYEPAIPTTLEGAGYTGAGLLGGYGLIALMGAPLRRRSKRYS